MEPKENPTSFFKRIMYIFHVAFLLNLVTLILALGNKINATFNILSLLSIGIGEVYCTYLLGKRAM